MEANLHLVVLSALLHDVGKFAQRAGNKATTGMEQEYCPGGETHRHVLYTDYFVEHCLPLPPDLEGKRGLLARIAAAHHRPDTDNTAECCLRDADWLSSGGDRMAGDSSGDYKSARLESIFSSISLQHTVSSQIQRYKLLPLSPGENSFENEIFPVGLEDAHKTGYKSLYEKFLCALEHIPLDRGITHYLHSISTLLERFTWCIPSSTYHSRADISLYDHMYTTASIAQALYTYRCEHPKTNKDDKLILFGGDLSGIQKYIFGTEETSSRGAGKLLRARSFVLQMLTRSIWLTMLDRVHLHSVARIMDAGGRFVLLLPATELVKHELSTLQEEVHAHLLQTYQGVLRMNFSTVEMDAQQLQRETFRTVFEQFNDNLEQTKLKPFQVLFRKGIGAVVPLDRNAYATFGECDMCRQRPASAPEPDDEENGRLCLTCRKLIKQVGRRLPRARYLVIGKNIKGFPLFDGLQLRVLDEQPDRTTASALDILNIKNRNDYSAAPIAGHIPQVTESDMERWKQEKRLSHDDTGQKLFAGEPVELGGNKTFAMLAEESRIPTDKGWRAVSCLAACKADVDNLGMLFSTGFGTGSDSSFSISRFAMFSRMLHHFFASYLTAVIEREFPNIYVVFAGGDDLFVIGPWADTIRFAARLHTDFAAFAGHNPDVTLSAGLPVFKSRLPVRDIREAAEAMLESAKSYPDKNAVSLFGATCSWNDFDDHLQLGEWLEKLCLDGAVTQGFVRRLLVYVREYRAFREGDMRKGLCLSHLQYDMARNCRKDRLSPEDMRRLNICEKNEQNLTREMGIAFALYKTRISA